LSGNQLINSQHLSGLLSRVLDVDSCASVGRNIAASMYAVDPSQARNWVVDRRGSSVVIGDREYDLENFWRILVVSIGKAAGLVAQAVADIFVEKIDTGIADQRKVV
jgi:glycerate-2-kinase